jgi:hypothetical protein
MFDDGNRRDLTEEKIFRNLENVDERIFVEILSFLILFNSEK